jgi:hypothetical protein
MTHTPNSKLQEIAKHLGQNIKAITGNEIGYLRISDHYGSRSGCSIYLHHTYAAAPSRSQRLIINLMITRSWKARHTEASFEEVVRFFSEFFTKGNLQLKVYYEEWHSSIGKNDARDRFYVDVTDVNLKDITNLVDGLKSIKTEWPDPERNQISR